MIFFLAMLLVCLGVGLVFGYVIFTLLFLLGAMLCGEPLPSLPKVAGTTLMALMASIMTNAGLAVVLYLCIEALGGVETDHVIFHAADIVAYVALLAVTIAIWGAVYNNALEVQTGGSIALFQAAVLVALDLLIGCVLWLYTQQFPIKGPLTWISQREALVARDAEGQLRLRNPLTVAMDEARAARPTPAPVQPSTGTIPPTPTPQPSDSQPPATTTGGEPPVAPAAAPTETTGAQPPPAEGDPGSDASGGAQTAPPPRPEPPTPDNALERRGAEAFAVGRDAEGFGLLHASLLSDDDTPLWGRYRWCAALARPTLALRYGIGVEDAAAATLRPLNATSWGSTAGAAADPLVAALADHALAGGPIAKGHAGQPFLVGTAAREALLAAAREQDLHVLAIAAVAAGKLQVRLVDVTTGRNLLAGEPVAVGGNDAAPAKKLVESVTLYLRVNVRLVDNAPLAADRVRARAEALAGSMPANPLAALAELRYYQRLGVLTADQAAGYFARLVGDTDGETLATGDAADRAQLVERWLP